ncbi:acetyl/propionyl/methylcrotonyl-CoA carboxylase subunit alpha [Paraburkholderia dilworthii]|uniref:Acetyl-CoA carboxylase biotin carboxylase subunit n=1 Tax=Paraburkholderia dilworthii TaxID=948106 RepID=A0ABW9D5B7_9BURK
MRSIKKLLVANRGEIAVRVMRTARTMGIETVAIYSSADMDAQHVAMAGQAVCIGAAPAADSYLNIAAILRAASLTGADAVHPGYGFLSENADFAEACVNAGLIFVGPSPKAISAMGDKAQAKLFMRETGLPCIPGYDGDEQDATTLAAAAAEIGFPVIVKATAGGGGRGMRIVETAKDFSYALESARSEARAAFGSDRMIIERVIRNPRHIEIQVLVDQHGNGVHFGERDCSVQRRHQKLIEEAPAPNLPQQTRDQMGSAAVAAAVALGYEGVGTFEFLLDASDDFYFMEMNTRLQVEHPVTECIAGVDLVEWQLRVAMSEPLDITQSDVRLGGHSIEVRLCAEDEVNGFLPQSGRIDLWQPPSDIRVEHGVATGAFISPYYDSMFAKLIAFGRTREDARRKLVSALRETVVFGIRTNRQTLINCLDHPEFVKGAVDTGFLQVHQDAVLCTQSKAPPLVLAVVGAALCHGAPAVSRRGATIHLVDEAANTHQLNVVCDDGSVRVEVGGQSIDLVIRHLSANRLRFGSGGVDYQAIWQSTDGRVHVQLEGRTWSFTDTTYASASTDRDEASDGRLRAPSNGRIAALLVAVGDIVGDGEALLTIEAMKMEHTLVAHGSVKITNVLISEGQSVSTGKVLIEFEPSAVA